MRHKKMSDEDISMSDTKDVTLQGLQIVRVLSDDPSSKSVAILAR